MNDVVEVIGAARLLPLVRVATADAALDIADRLCDAGLPAIELTATIEGWPDAIAALCRRAPHVIVGAGTITTAVAARTAIDAGARFLVSPYPAPEVRQVAAEHGLLFIEGGFTPAEIADACGRGPAKLFPAHVGGLALLRSLLAVLPGARIIPTGGIRLEDVAEWLGAGAFAVGVGSDLTAPGDVGQRVQELLGAMA
jgi:2-dehydro-3-deoxyphosphogluconate aldolase / (4S)-4-hydroxy-2-oxoglutarate aldolase